MLSKKTVSAIASVEGQAIDAGTKGFFRTPSLTALLVCKPAKV